MSKSSVKKGVAMCRCLKILVNVENWQERLSQAVQKRAQKDSLEGQLQLVAHNQLKIVVCGREELVDEFIDYLYDLFVTIGADVEQLEPFIKERDYRGIFRVI